ncbi:hypothetical protein DFH06DRAFT_1337139 [Mycena polygramma]|nr:hypothetical protein DFH06DRAFT_1337139 [Mycena polygramma]
MESLSAFTLYRYFAWASRCVQYFAPKFVGTILLALWLGEDPSQTTVGLLAIARFASWIESVVGILLTKHIETVTIAGYCIPATFGPNVAQSRCVFKDTALRIVPQNSRLYDIAIRRFAGTWAVAWTMPTLSDEREAGARHT